MPKKHVLVLTGQQGHRSLALAALSAYKAEGWRSTFVRNNSSLMSPFWEAYNLFYRYAPQLFGNIFTLGQQPLIMNSTKVFLTILNAHKVIAKVLSGNPSIIVSTHFAYNSFLAVLNKLTHLPVINIVSDPHSIHPVILMGSPAVNLVFDQTAVKEAKKLRPDAIAVPSGWFVRPEFYDQKAQSTIRRSLSIKSHQFVITFVAGSTGITSIVPLLQDLVTKIENAYIIVICGENKRLETDLKKLKTLPSTKLVVIGFTSHVPKLMKAADLVVGKAGPNMLFETVAVGAPFLATTYISGQENGNIEIVKKYKLGFVETNPAKAVKMILNLQKNPQKLARLKPHIKKLADYNQQSSAVLMAVTKFLLEKTTPSQGWELIRRGRFLPRFIQTNL